MTQSTGLLLSLSLASTACTADRLPSRAVGGAAPDAEALQAPRTLAVADRWERATRADDALAGDVPADAGCEPYPTVLEEAHLEIDMTACRYIVLSQPALTAGARGERLTGPVWHLGLLAASPGEAHAALSIRGEVLWEQRVPIPSPPEAWSLDAPLPSDIAAGEPVFFHLHNHGANRWRIGELLLEAR